MKTHFILFFLVFSILFSAADDIIIKVKRPPVLEIFPDREGKLIIPVVKKSATRQQPKLEFWQLPVDLDKFRKIRDQKITFYYTADEKDFPGPKNQQVIDRNGKLISLCTEKFYRSLLQQGSGKLSCGTRVNIVRDQKFSVIPRDCLGFTKSGYHVVPFHTLATNPGEMPHRNVYYIPATRGLKLPDGTRHDGFWFAHDGGSAFNDSNPHRIDMYVHDSAGRKLFEKQGIISHQSLRVYQVDEKTAAIVYRRYQSYLKKS